MRLPPLEVIFGSYSGVILETFFSILTTPVLVWFHTRFVLKNLEGKTVLWNTQTPRVVPGRAGWISYTSIGRCRSSDAFLAVVAWAIAPTYLAWVSPLLIGLFLAIPMAKFSGEGYLFRRLFLTPEEVNPPKELTVRFKSQLRDGDQFIHAVLDPFYNAIHVSLQRERASDSSEEDDYGAALATKLFEGGPSVLSARERRALLSDGSALAYLHALIWKTPAEQMHPAWVQGADGLPEVEKTTRTLSHQPAVRLKMPNAPKR